MFEGIRRVGFGHLSTLYAVVPLLLASAASRGKPEMPLKRDVLDRLTRAELLGFIDRYGLAVPARHRKDDLVQVLDSSRMYRMADALQTLPRKRLKKLCRDFELDDGGVRKADLAARLTTSRRKRSSRRRSGGRASARSARPQVVDESKFAPVADAAPAVGIDFGTSNCSMGAWWNGEPVLLPLEDDAARMPSVLFLTRERGAARIDEEELRRRVRSALAEQTTARRVALSNLARAEQDLQRAKAALRANERQLLDAKGRRPARDPRDIEQLARQAREVETRQTARDVLGREVESLSKSDSEMQAEQTLVLRREAFQRDVEAAARRGLDESLAQATGMYFGNEAVRHYLDGSEGNFVASPKSFIGADVPQRQLAVFVDVIARMLTYMRAVATRRFSDTGLTVIGRPVRFRGTAGTDGDEQAERVLREAASAAGFKAVEFLFEPIAAALDYERTLDEDKTLLVFDVGGGTTDCSMIRVGPSHRDRTDRKSDILGSEGIRLGGKDLDVALAGGTVAPLLGKGTYLEDGLPFPGYYFDSALSMDLPTRDDFHSASTESRLLALAQRSRSRKCIERLLKVQKARLGEYVLWEAEQAKIELSRVGTTRLKIERIESGLHAPVSRGDYEKLAADTHRRLMSVVDDVVRQAGTRPDEVYITGGMAQSPSLRSVVEMRLGDLKLVDGDYFGSVVSGLTTWAHRRAQGG